MKNRKFLPLIGMLVAAAVIAWSSGPVFAATNTADIKALAPNGTKQAGLLKPPADPVVAVAKKPILTKSGRKAALKKAAEAILQPPVTMLAPISPTDQTKVPHYFGPFPNWANSPFTLPDVAVEITGDGTGATPLPRRWGQTAPSPASPLPTPAAAIPRHTVAITGGGTGAAADAVVNTSSAVTAVTVDTAGTGYTAPLVDSRAAAATTHATAIAYGGVDAVAVTASGAATRTRRWTSTCRTDRTG